MANTLTEQEYVSDYLPAGWAAQLTPDQQARAIARGSARVQVMLPSYHQFPGVDDTDFTTPDVIVDLASRAAAVIECRMLGATNQFEDPSYYAALDASVVEDCAKIESGEHQVERVTITQGLTFANGDPYEDDECPLDCEPYEVIPESVRVDGYELGVDFDVKYVAKYRKFVFVRLNAEITAEDDALFEMSYLRRREIDSPSVKNIDVEFS